MVRRIAMLFPVDNVAESETMMRIAIAAQRMGIEARSFRRSEDIAAFAPDFVLSLTHQDAKLTPYPTYGVVTAPSRYYMQTARFVRNVLSYDAWFTVSDTVVRWLKDVQAGGGKAPVPIGYYANTVPAIGFTPPDLAPPRLAYFGTNWDGQRHADLFDHLSRLPFMEFYGPAGNWRHVGAAYKGRVPFDGLSSLEVYRRAGVGLCLSMRDFEVEGLPTNRIFEAAAGGALPIASRNRFVEQHFGDRVLYIDPLAPAAVIARQIEEHMAWIAANPQEARARARACWEVFDATLTQERMLDTVLTVHEEVLQTRGYAPVPADTGPSVAYVVRTGACGIGALRPALGSLAEQSHRNITAILVLGRPMDTAALADAAPGLHVKVVEAFDAPASTALALGLRGVDADLFGVLDPSTRLHPNHVASLVATLRRANGVQRRDPVRLAYGAHVEVDVSVPLPERPEWRDECAIPREESLRIGAFQPFDLAAVAEGRWIAHPNAWLACRDLLDHETLGDPDLPCGELHHLLLAFAERADFAFSCEVTLTHRVDSLTNFPPPTPEEAAAAGRRIHLRRWFRRFPGGLAYTVPGYDPHRFSGHGMSPPPRQDLIDLLPAMTLEGDARREAGTVAVANGAGNAVLSGESRPLETRLHRLSLYLAGFGGSHDGCGVPCVEVRVLDGDGAVLSGPHAVPAAALEASGLPTRFDWLFDVPDTAAGRPCRVTVAATGAVGLTILKVTLRAL